MTRNRFYQIKAKVFIFISNIILLMWTNFFIVISRVQGVPKTVKIIKKIVQLIPKQSTYESLDEISKQVDFLYNHFSFLFIAKKQKCLLRGFLLFFYGKRMERDVCLRFGCQWEDNNLKVHCWILENNDVRFELEDVIAEYETLLDYR